MEQTRVRTRAVFGFKCNFDGHTQKRFEHASGTEDSSVKDGSLPLIADRNLASILMDVAIAEFRIILKLRILA